MYGFMIKINFKENDHFITLNLPLLNEFKSIMIRLEVFREFKFLIT
jgi:hypothetical protein